MAKKCIPVGNAFGGVICIENMTLFILTLLTISVGYLYYKQFVVVGTRSSGGIVSDEKRTNTVIIDNRIDPQQSSLQNLYAPPLNTIDIRGPVEIASPPAYMPVNIRTSTANTQYRQIGILTKNNNRSNGHGTDPLILPLFGRNLLNGRDKWQYYTVANSGGVAFNAKLPISVNGRSCTSEYGCDSISNGDTVFVEGYDDTFRTTIYENATLNYIPF